MFRFPTPATSARHSMPILSHRPHMRCTPAATCISYTCRHDPESHPCHVQKRAHTRVACHVIASQLNGRMDVLNSQHRSMGALIIPATLLLLPLGRQLSRRGQRAGVEIYCQRWVRALRQLTSRCIVDPWGWPSWSILKLWASWGWQVIPERGSS